jgi:hypothetical protein
MITALYAALLGLFFTVLTLRVLALRGVTPLKWLAFNNFGAQHSIAPCVPMAILSNMSPWSC